MNPQKEKTVIALKKAQSLIAKIQKIIEQDAYCIDVMQQNLAAMGLLKGAHKQLMEGHLKTCFSHAMETGNNEKKQAMIDEILDVSRLVNK